MHLQFSEHVERWSLERLIPHARNARTHSDEQVAQIAGSIAEFGFVNPVLVGDDGVIVAGHGRVMAAPKLGLSEAPVIVLSHLSPTQRRALMIADNQIGTNAVHVDPGARRDRRRANPVICPYLRIGSPSAIGTTAILCPRGTRSLAVTPNADAPCGT